MLILATPFDCSMLGVTLLFMFMLKDITKDLTAFKDILSDSKNQDRDCGELAERLKNAIQIYSDAKQ